MEDKKIIGNFIIQIAGKPIENVEKALNLIAEKLNEEKENFKILNIEIEEADLDEETSLYSGFIDAKIRFNDISKLLGFIVDYTPNSIEIEEPDKIILTNNNITEILNDLSHIILNTQMQIRKLNANLHIMKKKIDEKENKN